jgi:hypothetical protein
VHEERGAVRAQGIYGRRQRSRGVDDQQITGLEKQWEIDEARMLQLQAAAAPHQQLDFVATEASRLRWLGRLERFRQLEVDDRQSWGDGGARGENGGGHDDTATV